MLRFVSILFALTIGIIKPAFGEIYGGGSLDYGSPHAGKDRIHGSIIIGNRFSQEGYFYGSELDFGTSLDDTIKYTTARAKLLFGISQEIFTPIIGLGGTVYIDNGTTYGSTNISGGIETKIGNISTLRIEAIRDFNPDHTTPVTIVRIGLLWKY